MTSGIAVETLSQFVRGDLNENYTDKDIEFMSVGEAFEAWLAFNGIIHYGDDIRRVLFDIITSSNYAMENLDDHQIRGLRYLFGLEVNQILK